MNIGLEHPKVKEWTGEAIIIDYFNNSHGELLIFIEDKSLNQPLNQVYSMLRFFKIGDNVEVSQEIPFKNIKKFAHSLFRQLKN